MASPYASGGVVNLQNTTGTANSYKGPTTVASNCKIVLGANNQIPDDSVLLLDTGSTVDFAGFSDVVKSVGNRSGTGGSIPLGAGTLTINDPAGESYAGGITGSSGSKIIKKGSGVWTLTGSQSAWDAEIQDGTWGIAGVNGLGANTVTIKGGKLASNGTTGRLVRAATVSLEGNAALGDTANTGPLVFTNYYTGAGSTWTIVGGTRTLTVNSTVYINGNIGEDASGRGLIKSGTGSLYLNGANTYSGKTTISRGTVYINSIGGVGGGASALGAPTTASEGTIEIGGASYTGTLRYTGGGDSTDRVVDLSGTTYGATIYASGSGPLIFTSDFTATGAGSKSLTLRGTSTGGNKIGGAIVDNSGENTTALTKTDAGKWILGGVNTYTGDTTITTGTLQVDGSIGNSAVTVAAAGTLSGSGAIGGAVVVNGTLSVGSSIGELTTGPLTLNGGGTNLWEIANATGAAGTGWDHLVVNGDLTVAATTDSKFTVKVAGDIANFDEDTEYSWAMASPSGTVSGFDAAKFAVDYADVANDLAGGTFEVEEGSVKVKFKPNHTPVANDAPFTAAKGIPLRIKVADLLSGYTSDADSDARALVSVGTPASGAASINGDYIYYTPGAAASDSFSYTVRDTRAYRAGDTVRTASANINVTVQDNGGTAQNIAFENGALTVTFQAVPGLHYDVERAQDPGGPWSALAGYANITPNSGGKITVTDTQPDGWSQAYYRLKWLGN